MAERVTTLLMWLMPPNVEAPPPKPPAGISNEQMQELIDGLRRETTPPARPFHEDKSKGSEDTRSRMNAEECLLKGSRTK